MTDLPVVLFVDDDEGVLAGLRIALRKLRRTYRFLFAVGADEALSMLATERVDVVVTDMRMPGLTGADLLHRVRAEHPEIIRYVLSGEAGVDLVMQSVPVAHRWLSKPCDRTTLVDALADAVRHRRYVTEPAILAAIGETSALPTPPALYAELLELAADADAAVDRVATLVGRDPAIAAKVMQWANSAFSGGNPVSNLHEAVIRIGLTAVSQLILSAEVTRSFLDTESIPGCDPESLAAHADTVSALAFRLARPSDAVIAGLGGLLGYIGLLVEIGHLPDRLAEAYALAERSNIELIDAERQLFGVGHPDLGAHLLSVWGLPSDAVLLIAGGHDRPDPVGQPASVKAGRTLPALDAVRMAGVLAQRRSTFDSFGSPYRMRIDDDLAAAVADIEAGSALTEESATA